MMNPMPIQTMPSTVPVPVSVSFSTMVLLTFVSPAFNNELHSSLVLGYLDDAVIRIDLDPIARRNHCKRILIEIGDRGDMHHDSAERNLCGHLVENQRFGRSARKPRHVESR